jgi:hypothetical protein
MKEGKYYIFSIDAYTPDTLPLSRCADYLHELAEIFGEASSVHFIKVAEGSTQLVNKVDHEAIPKVDERIYSIENGTGSGTGLKAYEKINRMLLEDNGKGVLIKEKAEILKFPGKKEDIIKPITIQQPGELAGEICRVGGLKDIVHITLSSEGNEISNINVSRALAKELGKHLFEQIKLSGSGKWERDIEGKWNLVSFTVDSYEVLDETTLSQTVLAMRSFKGEWGKDALSEILESRNS